MDYKPYPKELGRDVTWDALESVQQKFQDLKRVRKSIDNKEVFLGLDGYIDSLYSLVAKRQGVNEYTLMRSMREFSKKAEETAGSSCNVERILKKKIGGGFGPNTARAVGSYGVVVRLMGCLGAPSRIFLDSLPGNVHLYSVSDPGETCALEFEDGKIMLTDFGNVHGLTWDLIKGKIGVNKFIELINNVDVIGQGHWALVAHMNEIWEDWLSDIFPSLDRKKRVFFVDSADMSKRPFEHRRKMVSLLEEMTSKHDFTTILSMNDKEAIQLTESFDNIDNIQCFEDYYVAGQNMMDVFDISAVVIHHPHFATISTKKETFHVKEGYTSKPRFTTAAGDHFNGGIILSFLSEMFKPEEALVIANSATAFFVRTGKSPNLEDLSRFINNYKQYVENDLDQLV
ncbi:MAG: PfkB family carbohydrate kinase [Promethearchaeota archaeon]